MSKRKIIATSLFKRDLKRVKKQGKKVEKLISVVNSLAEGKQLEERYKDHRLSGEYSDTRECHIEPDWLLIYQIADEKLSLVLTRTGSHSELFK